MEDINPAHIEILDYTDEHKEAIKTLNYEWLEKYFRVEDGDRIALSDPKKEIIDKGGFIYYAGVDGEILGTVSLISKKDGIMEVAKMAVSQKAQGLGIGKILVEYCIASARSKNVPKLILYSNRQLVSALHIYRKFGFTETAMDPGLYERANIKMEKIL